MGPMNHAERQGPFFAMGPAHEARMTPRMTGSTERFIVRSFTTDARGPRLAFEAAPPAQGPRNALVGRFCSLWPCETGKTPSLFA